MARTILEIAVEAAERDATAPAPSSLFDSSNNRVSKILRIAAGDTMRDVLTRTGWLGISELHSTWAFATYPGRYAYPLPPDFLRAIPNTEHRGGWPMGLVGPASPQTWAHWLFGGAATPVQMGWRIRNNALWIEPVPSAYELITIDYVSRFPVASLLAPGDYDFTASPPTCNAPFVPRDGHLDLATLSITEDPEGEAEYEAGPGWDVAVFGEETFEALRRISPLSGVTPLPQVRRPSFTADTDKPAFEDDHLLSLGMTFRARRALGKDYAEIAAEYEAEIEMKLGSDAGGAREIRLGCGDDVPQAVPLGGGRWMVS